MLRQSSLNLCIKIYYTIKLNTSEECMCTKNISSSFSVLLKSFSNICILLHYEYNCYSNVVELVYAQIHIKKMCLLQDNYFSSKQ